MGGKACAWLRQWTAFGLQCHPRNADCRGSVFAVFAQIPRPSALTHQKMGECLKRHSPIPAYLSRLLVSFVKKGFTALRRQGILRGILHRIVAHRVARSRALQIG